MRSFERLPSRREPPEAYDPRWVLTRKPDYCQVMVPALRGVR